MKVFLKASVKAILSINKLNIRQVVYDNTKIMIFLVNWQDRRDNLLMSRAHITDLEKYSGKCGK